MPDQRLKEILFQGWIERYIIKFSQKIEIKLFYNSVVYELISIFNNYENIKG